MTSKGQVTVPKYIRDALGLLPGQEVEFELGGDGTARIFNAKDPSRVAARKADFLARVEEAKAKFRGFDTMPGMGGLEYQRWLRGEEGKE